MKSLFEVPSRTAHIQRFAGKYIGGHRSSISEHTFEVVYYTSLILHAMRDVDQVSKSPDSFARAIAATNFESEAMMYAIIHDIPEVFTGDVPYTAKAEFPELKAVLDKVEKAVSTRFIPTFDSNPSDDVKFLCKLADAIAVTREIVHEYKANNPLFTDKEIGNCRVIFETAFHKYQKCRFYEEIVAAFKHIVVDTPVETILSKNGTWDHI